MIAEREYVPRREGQTPWWMQLIVVLILLGFTLIRATIWAIAMVFMIAAIVFLFWL